MAKWEWEKRMEEDCLMTESAHDLMCNPQADTAVKEAARNFMIASFNKAKLEK